jgi:hypothetical protein
MNLMVLAEFFREMRVVVVMVSISCQAHDFAFDFLRQSVAWHPASIAVGQCCRTVSTVAGQ